MTKSSKTRRPISDSLKIFIEAPLVQNFILFVIIVNAVVLGLQTSRNFSDQTMGLLNLIDSLALGIFVVELLIKIFVYRASFVKDGWNVFDFIIVAVAVIPGLDAGFSVLRALRIMRALRVMTIVPSMRTVVGALLSALPGMGSVVIVLVLVFYISAVMATQLFGSQQLDDPAYLLENPEVELIIQKHPEVLLIHEEWFGTVAQSLYSLFQIMTLESWSMGIVRPVVRIYPMGWAFFVPFIVLTSFMVLNLFIALIVNSMSEVCEDAADAEKDESQSSLQNHEQRVQAEMEIVSQKLESLERTLAEMREIIRPQSPPDP